MSASVTCPVCSRPAPARERVRWCKACGHRWMPMTRRQVDAVAAAVYTADYRGYVPDASQDAAFAGLLAREILPRLPEGAAILDVGCGNGAFLAAATRSGRPAQGIDLSEASAAMCRGRGLEASSGDFLEFTFGRRFGAITFWDVLEHLPEPGAFLARARELLAPGGLLAGKVPCFGGLSVGLGGVDRKLAAVLLGAPDHIQYFTPASLRRLFEARKLSFATIAGPTSLHSPPQGGSWRRRGARAARRAISGASGDRNVYFVAFPES